MTQSELLESIQLTSAERIAVVSRKEDSFVENKSIPESVELFKSLIQTLGLNTLDFLACNTLLDPLWTQFYTSLQTTGVTVGASNDRTGNLKYGGDWTMESTGQDIETVYFNKSIEYYKYLLDISPFTTICLKTDGLYGAGLNEYRPLGIDGTDGSPTGNVTIFTKITSPNVGFDKKIIRFVYGPGHTVVLLEDGSVWGAGWNHIRQLGINGTNGNVVGNVNIFTKVSLLKKAIWVSCGFNHTLVILEDGTLWSAGFIQHEVINNNNEIGRNETNHSFNKIILPKKAVRVFSGYYNAIVLLEDGSLWGTGGNGSFFGFGNSGAVWDFTEITSSNVGFDKNAVWVSCGYTHTMVILKDGTLWGAGGLQLFPDQLINGGRTINQFTHIPLPKKAIYVACGFQYTMVILEDGTLWGVGANDYRQLGIDGTDGRSTGNVTVFTQIPFSKKVIEVVCGEDKTRVLLEDGTVWGAGWNNTGELGPNGINTAIVNFTKILDGVLSMGSPANIVSVSNMSKVYFLANSFVTTDQGYIYVSKLDPAVHTIMGHSILSITDIYNDLSLEKVMVFLKKETYTLTHTLPS
jgi:alpha-tubulin suppressor-like RCC1 family protein